MVSTVQSKPPSQMVSRSHPCVEYQPSTNVELELRYRYDTHFIFFFPSNLLLSEATVRPAGRGGSGGASGARTSTAVVSGSPFKLGSWETSCSTSWSLEAETPPLALAPVLDLAGFGFEFEGLSSALRGSSVGSGSFFGDNPILYSGWWSDSIQRRRPRCTPRSPAISSLTDQFEDYIVVHTSR